MQRLNSSNFHNSYVLKLPPVTKDTKKKIADFASNLFSHLKRLRNVEHGSRHSTQTATATTGAHAHAHLTLFELTVSTELRVAQKEIRSLRVGLTRLIVSTNAQYRKRWSRRGTLVEVEAVTLRGAMSRDPRSRKCVASSVV